MRDSIGPHWIIATRLREVPEAEMLVAFNAVRCVEEGREVREMMRPQPMIVVHDVEACSRWFQDVLGLVSGHGGDEYEMLMAEGEMVVQLHRWDAHEHPHLGDESNPSRGNGVLLWFATDHFEALLARVHKANARILDGPLYNPNGRQQEIWLEGPEGYRVVVAGPRNRD